MGDSTLATLLESAWNDARARWPEIALDPNAFRAHVLRHAGPTPERALPKLHVADLYLALACAGGDPVALAHFERLVLDDVRLAVARVAGSAANADDAKQLVFQRLLLGQEMQEPKILDYSGAGELRAWFRVSLVRALLDEQRRLGKESPLEEEGEFFGIASPERDPELEYLRRLYTHEFRAAFETAATKLDAAERNALRAQYVHRLGIDGIAQLLGIHRATAARRVASARERLLGETRRELMVRLSLTRTELESVMRLVESGLHVTLTRVFE